MAAAAVGIVGVAFGQVEPPTSAAARFIPEWDLRPSGRDFARHYPRAALDSNQSGTTILCCTPRADRTINCEFGAEWPRDEGFLAAAGAISHSFRMTEASFAAYQSRPVEWLIVPINFRVTGSPSRGVPLREILRRGEEMSQRAVDICAAGGPPPPIAPAPER